MERNSKEEQTSGKANFKLIKLAHTAAHHSKSKQMQNKLN
jgi:hypothetical protein